MGKGAEVSRRVSQPWTALDLRNHRKLTQTPLLFKMPHDA